MQKRNSTFANGEVKEFKEVREVKAICFIAKYTTKKKVLAKLLTTEGSDNFFNYYNFRTYETSGRNKNILLSTYDILYI